MRSRTNLTYEDDQLWLPIRQAVGFVLEDGAGAEYGTTDFIERDERRDEAVEFCTPPLPEADLVHPQHPQLAPVIVPITTQHIDIDDQSCSVDDTATIESSILSNSPELSLPMGSWQAPSEQQKHGEASSCSSHTPRDPTRISAIVEDYISPASPADLSRRHESGRRPNWGTGEHSLLVADGAQDSPMAQMAQMVPANDAPIVLTHREALLLQHFATKLAPWMDCCDPGFHFAQEVPRRATRIGMVLYAVIAFASRHLFLMTGHDPNEGSYYLEQCLEMMEPELSRPVETYSDNLFVAMVCIRAYEELNNTPEGDNFPRLAGVERLLRAISTFAYSGGLAEAASWQALRQDVHVAIRDKVQPSFDLNNYGLARTYNRQTDATCANVAVFLFARILRLLYAPPRPMLFDEWAEIEHQVAHWNVQRSLVFQPLFVKEASIDEHQPFPIVRMSNPAQGKLHSQSRTVGAPAEGVFMAAANIEIYHMLTSRQLLHCSTTTHAWS